MRQSDLSPAQSFIYTHACRLIKGNNWQQAALATLRKIEKFKASPANDRPPVMVCAQWDSIEQEIRAMAEGEA